MKQIPFRVIELSSLPIDYCLLVTNKQEIYNFVFAYNIAPGDMRPFGIATAAEKEMSVSYLKSKYDIGRQYEQTRI